MDNYVGKRLDGRYEVQEIVGVGGMSVVYKAYDNVDDRIVAVQYNDQIGLAFHPELSGDTRIHEYFISLCEK